MQNEILRRERMPLSSALALNLSLVRHKPGFVGSLLAGVSLLVSAHAFAADQAAPAAGTAPTAAAAPAPAAAADDQPIEEVVVTARHREEKAQDVPIPMTVLNGDDLGVDRIEQIGTKLPSANITFNNPRQTAIAVRGLGNNPASEGMFSSTGVFVDGVYMGRPGMVDTGLNDLDQIELLRGPQGTQWGKNTTAGALNITTLKPSMTSGGDVGFTVGNLSTYQETGAITGAVTDNSSARISFYNDDRFTGLMHNLTDDQYDTVKRQGVRAQWLASVGDDLTLRFIADTNNENDQQGATQLYGVSNPGYWGYVNALKAQGVTTFNSSDKYSSLSPFDTSEGKKVVQGGSSLQADYSLGGGYNLTSITAYRQWNFSPLNDSDQTNADIEPASGGIEHDKQYSQEFRVSSPTGGFVDYTAGLYYFKQTVASDQYADFGSNTTLLNDFFGKITNGVWAPAANGNLYANKDISNLAKLDDNSYAAFISSNWHPADKLTITTGLRNTYENSGIVDSRNLENTPYATATNPNIQNVSYSRTDNNLTGDLTLNYKVNDDFSTYTTYAHGAKAGAMVNTVTNGTLLDRNNLVVAPEKINDGELGFKSQWLDHRLTFNADAFYALVQNYQATATEIDPVTNKTANVLQNVGWVTTRGTELDTAFKLTHQLTLGFAGAYDLAMYRSWTHAPCPGEDVINPPTFCSESGRPVAGAPKWNGDLSLKYEEKIAEDWVGYIRTDVTYKSSYYGPWVQDDSSFSQIKANWLTNLTIGSKILDGRLDESLWVRNLFDRHYEAYVSSGSNGIYIGQAGDPFAIGLTTTVKF